MRSKFILVLHIRVTFVQYVAFLSFGSNGHRYGALEEKNMEYNESQYIGSINRCVLYMTRTDTDYIII